MPGVTHRSWPQRTEGGARIYWRSPEGQQLSSGRPESYLATSVQRRLTFLQATKNPPKRVFHDLPTSCRLPSWRGLSSLTRDIQFPVGVCRLASLRRQRERSVAPLHVSLLPQHQKSRFDTARALDSMKSRRGSTASPIRVLKIWSAAMASSMVTLSMRRTSGSMVVSHN